MPAEADPGMAFVLVQHLAPDHKSIPTDGKLMDRPMVILATGGIGILWRHYRQGRLEVISVRELYGFGVVVHPVMLARAEEPEVHLPGGN